jgi:FkbM family methyltransferase
MKPVVSVCIPAYQQPAFLARAVESVFAQDFGDFEVIVTDDSEAPLYDAIKRWHGDERLIYRHNQVRLGSPGNWNAAMKLARSDLIKFLHHDDWFSDRTSLARFVAVMNERPEINFAFSASNACEDDGRLIFVHCPSSAQIVSLRRHPLLLQFGNFIGAPSATIFRKAPGFEFDPHLRWVVDVDAYLRLLGSEPRFEFIAEALVCVASNGAHQVTRSVAADPVSQVAEHLYLYSKHRPTGCAQRVSGLKVMLRLLSGFSGSNIDTLSGQRIKYKRTLEEHVSVGILGLRSKISNSILAFKKIIYAKIKSKEMIERQSYAQCGEDIIIDFLLMWIGVNDVLYLDIGAHHPAWLSNTYYFYRRGYRGILIEPDEELCKNLRKKRPADTVLNLAVGASGDSKMHMYIMTSRTLNTLDLAQAEQLQLTGRERIEAIRDVRCLGINEILLEYFEARTPNLVSLDIEGMDFDVLKAWDFSRFRPEVFCVETLTYSQNNEERKLTKTIDLMLANGYRVYADTYVNTIFVCHNAWTKRLVHD